MDAAMSRLVTRILILALIIGAPRPRTFRDRQGICQAQCSGLSLPPRWRVLLRLHCILVTGFGESFLGSLPSGRAALSLSSRLWIRRTALTRILEKRPPLSCSGRLLLVR